MKDILLDKVSIIIGILGLATSVTLKDWIAVCLWIIVILQDYRIIELKKEKNE